MASAGGDEQHDMTAAESLPANPQPTSRWFYPAPAWLVYSSPIVTGLLFASERWRWFSFNEHKGWTVLIAVAGVGVVLALMLVWFVIALVFRLRFQFSIRMLLVMVVAVALPCSWLAVEIKKARRQWEVAIAIQKLGGEATRDWEYGPFRWMPPAAQEPVPAWLVSLLGDDFFGDLTAVSLEDCQVTDVWLDNLQNLPQLHMLSLNGTHITDTGLERLRGFSQLYDLRLRSTSVTDAALERLSVFKDLQVLALTGTKVTDAGIKRLKQFKKLRFVLLGGTKASVGTLDELAATLPDCEIIPVERGFD